MKKVLYAILALATLTLASCEKDPIGGTATEKMAGEWYVECIAVDADGEIVLEDADLFGIGKFWLNTFNTAANTTDSMWVGDVDGAMGNIWDDNGFQVKVGCNLANGTFSVANGFDIIDEDVVNITDGKILFGAGKTPSGVQADSIVFDIAFGADPYAGAYYDRLRITGIRYTGLAADD